MEAILRTTVELMEGEILYIVSFLKRHMLEGIQQGIIVQNDVRGYSLNDAMAFQAIVDDMSDFAEKFGIDAGQAWDIFINNSVYST